MSKEVVRAESAVLPNELRLLLGLSITSPNLFGLVKRAVEKYNRTIDIPIDPIFVAQSLVKEGYTINAIPERAVEITAGADGVLTAKAEILRVVQDDKVNEFPPLDAALYILLRKVAYSDLTKIKESFREILNRECSLESKERGRYALFSDPFTVKSFLKYEEAFTHLDDVALTALAQKVRRQLVVLLDQFKSGDDLISPSELKRRKESSVAHDAKRREEFEQRNAELNENREAAEQWLFGNARALFESKGSVELAAQELAQNKKAIELIAKHNIRIFEFIDKQLKEAEVRRRGDKRVLNPLRDSALSVLLIAFGKKRELPVHGSSHSSQHLLAQILHWQNAKFVAELPPGVYPKVIANERERTEKFIRSRNSSHLNEHLLEDMDDELKSMLDADERSSQIDNSKMFENYGRNPAAALWWDLPQWVQWKQLRPHIGVLVKDLSRKNRTFNARAFSEYLELSVRANDRQRAVVEENEPSRARYEMNSSHYASKVRSSMLLNIKELFDVDFVMTRDERDVYIQKQEEERIKLRRKFSWL